MSRSNGTQTVSNGTQTAEEVKGLAVIAEAEAIAAIADNDIVTAEATFYGDVRTRKSAAFSHNIASPHFLPLRDADKKIVHLPTGETALSSEAASRKQVHAAMFADLTAMQRNGRAASVRRDGTFILDSGEVITVTYHNGKQDVTRRVRLCGVIADTSKQAAMANVILAAKQADGSYVQTRLLVGNLKAVAGSK
jgi:flagellar hook protein FlgE